MVPTSSGIKRFIPSDAGDYYMMDTSYRDQMILDHILIQPIQSKDLVENATFKTVTGKIINYGSEKGLFVLIVQSFLMNPSLPLFLFL